MTDLPVLHLSGPILTGPGEVVDELWVVGGRVTFDRPLAQAQTIDGWVLPGLVDAHSHVGLSAHGATDAATAEEQALTERAAGALLLRDAGSPADTRWIQDRDDLPRLVRADRHIARTRRYIRNFADEVEPEDLVAQVERAALAGDGWVKIVGDWLDRETGDLAPCWPREVLFEAMKAARALGARVTAHCFGEDSLRDLLEAGVNGIEHGTGLTDEAIALCVERGVTVVPTLVNIATFPRLAEGGEAKFPVWAAHMRALHERRYDVVRSAYEAGVLLANGTDAGGSLPHGLVGAEAVELAAAGLPHEAVLDATCWRARTWLGFPGLQEGEAADLVVLPGDPRDDIAVLQHPTAVVLRGRVVEGS